MVLCTKLQLQISFWHDRSKWTAYDDGHNIIMKTVNDKAQHRRIIVNMCTVFRCYSVHSSDVVLAAAANWQDDTATVMASCILFSVRFECQGSPRDLPMKETFDNTMHKSSRGGKVCANSYWFYNSNTPTNVRVIFKYVRVDSLRTGIATSVFPITVIQNLILRIIMLTRRGGHIFKNESR